MSRLQGDPPPATGPAAPRIARGRIDDPDGIVREVDVDLAESPLAWLKSRRGAGGEALIDDDAFEAGERLRRDYTIGGLLARTTMNWDVFGGRAERRTAGSGGGLVLTEAAMAARERVTRALTAVGPDFAGVLVDVCCHLRGLGDVERDNRWPVRSGKVVLRLALAALARHYGLDPGARGPDVSRIRQWGTADYKPKA